MLSHLLNCVLSCVLPSCFLASFVAGILSICQLAMKASFPSCMNPLSWIADILAIVNDSILAFTFITLLISYLSPSLPVRSSFLASLVASILAI